MDSAMRLTPNNGRELDRVILDPGQISHDVDVPPDGVGQDLRRARGRSGKMLMDVSRDLKIPPHHLIAIEAGRFDALPGPVYAIGFVRSYSAYLGLDAPTFVARLKAEMAGSDARLRVIGPLPPPECKNLEAKFTGSGDRTESIVGLLSPPERKTPHAVIAGLLIAVLIYSGYYVLASARRMAEPPVIPVPAQLAAEAELAQKQVDAPPLAPAEQTASVLREPALAPSTEVAPTQPVLVPSPQTAELEPAALPELAPPPPDAAPKPPLAVPAERGFHEPLPLGRRYGRGNSNARIILRVHRSIRIAVQGTRNRMFIDRTLDAGDTYRVPNMVGLKLSAPDGGAIEVILDDTTIGFAGKDGVVAKNVSLDPQSIIERQQPG